MRDAILDLDILMIIRIKKFSLKNKYFTKSIELV